MRSIAHFKKQMRSFLPYNGFYDYLVQRKSQYISQTVTTYRLSTILLAIKEIIEEDQLIDLSNFSIIVFKDQLEIIFGAKAFHISQIRPKIESFLEKRNGYEPVTNLDLGNREVQAMNFWIEYEPIELNNSLLQLFAEPASKEIRIQDQLALLLKNKGLLSKKVSKFKYARFFSLISILIANTPTVGGNEAIFDLRNDELGMVINRNFATKNQIFKSLSALYVHNTVTRCSRRTTLR